MSSTLIASLRDVLAEIDARPEVRAIVLTGADPAFCAGLDLTELAQPGSRLGSRTNKNAVPDLATPLIGAINGAAVTGGLELALACDFLIASERATFADSHARMGIQPGWGLTVELAEAVGYRRAREMSATGNFIGAQTALEWGLVNHVVPHSDLLDFSRGLAADIASSDPDALSVLFATYDAGSQVSRGEARQIETTEHRRFHAKGIDHAQVSQRRAAVIERGRAQK
jgi:enoyl-CoA hydratase